MPERPPPRSIQATIAANREHAQSQQTERLNALQALQQMGLRLEEQKAWRGCGKHEFDAQDRKLKALADISPSELDALRIAMGEIEVPDGFHAHLCRFCPTMQDSFGSRGGGTPDGFDFHLPGSLSFSLDLDWYWVYSLVNVKEWRLREQAKLNVTFQLHFVDPTTGRVVSERPNFDLPAPTKRMPFAHAEREFARGPAISDAARQMLEVNGTLRIDEEARSLISDETYGCEGRATFLILVCSDVSTGLVLDHSVSYSGFPVGFSECVVPTVFETPDWFQHREHVAEWHRQIARQYPGSTGPDEEEALPHGLRHSKAAEQIDRVFPFGLRSAVLRMEAPEGRRAAEAQEPSSAAEAPAPREEEPPADFICPITTEIMSDPVMAADGHSYERSAIERWLATKSTSPMTGEALVQSFLAPNHTLRRQIREWEEANTC